MKEIEVYFFGQKSAGIFITGMALSFGLQAKMVTHSNSYGVVLECKKSDEESILAFASGIRFTLEFLEAK